MKEPKETKTKAISVLLTPSEADRLEQRANSDKRSMSAVLRLALLAYLGEPGNQPSKRIVQESNRHHFNSYGGFK